MLTENRLSKIESIVNQNGSVAISDLMGALDTSESTIRRDLSVLDSQKRLIRVRGGAVALNQGYGTRDDDVGFRKTQYAIEKEQIGEYAASFITDDDFVFLDAGTTTEALIPYIKSKKAAFVTNALSHAMKLSARGITVYILGGAFKNTTEAIVGEETVASLRKFNFTKGFFGVNGITTEQGYTTPEIRESMVKQYAFKKSARRFVLADHSKFGAVAAITFGAFDHATVITDQTPDAFRSHKNILEVNAS